MGVICFSIFCSLFFRFYSCSSTEAIVGSRQNAEKKMSGTNESILSMLLTEMDGVGTTGIYRDKGSGGGDDGSDKVKNVS